VPVIPQTHIRGAVFRRHLRGAAGIFRLLVPTGEIGIPAGEIAERLDIPSATLTFHLKELTNAGLVESRREGRSIIYSLRVKGMQELLSFLANDCCQSQPELCIPTSGITTLAKAKS
jgi:ArsR family transcriptional regulator, arsenate/arsenite/antimonite-responsive transcriptional repressor